MTGYDITLQNIYRECHVNNGNAFELEISSGACVKHFRKKKHLFSCEWIHAPLLKEENYYLERERELSQLPKGIKLIKNVIVSTPLPDPYFASDNFATERSHISYKVIVSAEFSQKIAHDYRNSKVIVSDIFDRQTCDEAKRFMNRIVVSHNNLLERLASADGYYLVTNTSFGNGEDGLTFKGMGMKPLSNEAQRLGFALAIADNRSALIPDSAFYFLERSDDRIFIHRLSRRSQKSNLKDW